MNILPWAITALAIVLFVVVMSWALYPSMDTLIEDVNACWDKGMSYELDYNYKKKITKVTCVH